MHVEQFSVHGFRRIMSFDTVNLAHNTPPNILYKTHITYDDDEDEGVDEDDDDGEDEGDERY